MPSAWGRSLPSDGKCRTLRAQGGHLAIKLRREEGAYLIDFVDDGPGVARHFLPEMFQRFTREEASRARHSGGSGLGLSIARAICAAHGGASARRYRRAAVCRFALFCRTPRRRRKQRLDNPLTQRRAILDECVM
jgi:signal transduction histidine kinase